MNNKHKPKQAPKESSNEFDVVHENTRKDLGELQGDIMASNGIEEHRLEKPPVPLTEVAAAHLQDDESDKKIEQLARYTIQTSTSFA